MKQYKLVNKDRGEDVLTIMKEALYHLDTDYETVSKDSSHISANIQFPLPRA